MIHATVRSIRRKGPARTVAAVQGALALALVAAFPARAATPAPAAASATPANCEPAGNLSFICGQQGPEDLVPVAGTPWVIASSLGDGALRLIDSRNRSASVLFPARTAVDRPDTATYNACPGPLSATEKAAFKGHGLAVRAVGDGTHRLFVVHHGARESIEVFSLDLRGSAPRIAWIGCAITPGKASFNSVAALPDGGFIATNFMERGAPMQPTLARLMAGEPYGEPYAWNTASGWRKLDIGPVSGPNGIEVSPDGQWLYVALWGNKALLRQSLGDGPRQRATVSLDFRLDNIRLAADGMLYGAGQGDHSSHAVRIDPQTLVVTPLLDRADDDAFGHATIAVPVAGDIWIGAFRGDRIAVLPTKP